MQSKWDPNAGKSTEWLEAASAVTTGYAIMYKPNGEATGRDPNLSVQRSGQLSKTTASFFPKGFGAGDPAAELKVALGFLVGERVLSADEATCFYNVANIEPGVHSFIATADPADMQPGPAAALAILRGVTAK